MIDRDLTVSELTLYVKNLNILTQTLTDKVLDLKLKVISLEKSAEYSEEAISDLDSSILELNERLDDAKH